MRFRTAPVLNMREKHSWHSFSFFLFWRVLVSRPQRVADRVATVFAVWQVQCFCQWGSHLATRGRRPAADITSHCRARQHVRERCEADSGSATTQGVWLFAKQTERQSKKQKKKIHDEEEEDAEENKIWKNKNGKHCANCELCRRPQMVRPKIAALHFNVSILAGINSRVFMLAALENQPAHTHTHTHSIYTLCGPPSGIGLVGLALSRWRP